MRIAFILLAISILITSCRRIGNGHGNAETFTSLREICWHIKSADNEMFKVTLDEIEGMEKGIKSVLVNTDGLDLRDAWLNEIKILYKDSHVYVWSAGQNQKDDSMTKDDIVMRFKIEQVESMAPDGGGEELNIEFVNLPGSLKKIHSP